jgi:hypothetical protein
MAWCMGRKTINQYLDGELSPRAAQRVERHVAACSRCAEALAQLRTMDAALRRDSTAARRAPDIATRVTAELHSRGAFLKARVAAGKRRLVGGHPVLAGSAGAAAVAALVLLTIGLTISHASKQRWIGEAEPVLQDTVLVLVRLDRVEASQRVAVARDESKKLGLSERLSGVLCRAEPTWAGDLAPLERTFKLLAEGQPLPADLVAGLNDGELLGRAERLRQSLLRGG